jgi:hypothetical protein
MPAVLWLATVSHTPYLFDAVQVDVNLMLLLLPIGPAVPQVTTLCRL